MPPGAVGLFVGLGYFVPYELGAVENESPSRSAVLRVLPPYTCNFPFVQRYRTAWSNVEIVEGRCVQKSPQVTVQSLHARISNDVHCVVKLSSARDGGKREKQFESKTSDSDCVS
jgi:hypothetical protein